MSSEERICDSCSAKVPVHAVYCPSCGHTLSKAKTAKKTDPLIGTILDHKYRLVKKVGEGGMAIIYKAEHIFLKEWRAIKIIKKPDQRKETQYGRFLREAKLARKVSAITPHVIRVDDFGYDQKKGMYYYSMELLEGRTLRECLRKKPPYMTPEELAPAIVQTCIAMEVAHQCGMIHRDLKPDNIFLINYEGREDFVKVLDFGLARPLSPEEAQYTDVGKVVGTPEYMSPEQCRGPTPEQRLKGMSCVDARSDVYSLGIIMYQCLSGKVPFSLDGDPIPQNFLKLMSNQISKMPPPLHEVKTSIPRDISDIVQKAIQKKPLERYQTMFELQQAIMQLDFMAASNSFVVPSQKKTSMVELTDVMLPSNSPLKNGFTSFQNFQLQIDPEMEF